jgi:hypothetical protein
MPEFLGIGESLSNITKLEVLQINSEELTA